MKLFFIYINPTGRTAIPPNVSTLIGHLKSRRTYSIKLFDTTFYKFDLGKPKIKEAWTTGYFLPAKNPPNKPKLKNTLYDDINSSIERYKPELIAVSCYSNQYALVQRILINIKKFFPQIPNIVGGCHPSFCPDEVISDPFVDMICVGEGEEALVEICDRINNNEDLTTIQNIWLKKENQIIKNPVREPMDLNQIGLPDWSIFDDIHLYQPFHGNHYRVGMIEYGRGCPNRCSYCANSSYLNLYSEHLSSYIRHPAPALFIDKLKKLKHQYNLELIYFQDATFLTMNVENLEKLTTLYENDINLPCILLSTAPSINDHRIKCLKRMNCISVNMGIEQGNPDFRKKHLNRKMSNNQIVNSFNLLKSNGIATAAYNVIGFPYETREDIFKTIELNRQCLPDSIYAQIFYPIKGCDLYKKCIENNFFCQSNESLHSQICSIGKVSLLENCLLNRDEIHGLLKTFLLYVKLPKIFFPLIRLLENDTELSHFIVKILTDLYWSLEPKFQIRSKGTNENNSLQ